MKEAKDLYEYLYKLKKENEGLKKDIDSIIKYANDCIKELEKEDQYISESVDVISLLKQVHHTYINKLIQLNSEKQNNEQNINIDTIKRFLYENLILGDEYHMLWVLNNDDKNRLFEMLGGEENGM